MDFIPFEARHLALVDVQPAQRDEARARLGDGAMLDLLAQRSIALTAVDGGRAVACAGVLFPDPADPGKGKAWALIGAVRQAQWLAIARTMRAVLDQLGRDGCRRVDAETRADFAHGCRLLDLLGFVREGTMRRFGADGADYVLYARIAAARGGA